jgi:AraC-like DNA-binding protein
MIELRTRLKEPLDRFVDCLWYSSGEFRRHRKERLLPTGCVDLVFKLRADRTVRVFHDDEESAQNVGEVVVSGAYSRHYALDISQPSPTLGVHFRPGGAAPLLGVPPGALTDRHVSLAELWGRRSAVLRMRLMRAGSVSSLFDLMEQALLDRLTEPPADYLAIMQAVRAFSLPAPVSVKAMCDLTGYRSKLFIRLFHEFVGVTPKLFCRIRRFQSVLDRLVGGEHVEWANVAADGGYYDQPHLIRDFRAFAGVTPLEYRPVGGNLKNHLALNS